MKQPRSGKLGLPDGENNTEPEQLRSRLLKQLGSGKLGLCDGRKSKKVLGELKKTAAEWDRLAQRKEQEGTVKSRSLVGTNEL